VKHSSVGAVGERNQLRFVGRISRVDCHVRRASIRVADRLDQSPTGAGAQLEKRRLWQLGRKVREKVFPAVVSVAVEDYRT